MVSSKAKKLIAIGAIAGVGLLLTGALGGTTEETQGGGSGGSIQFIPQSLGQQPTMESPLSYSIPSISFGAPATESFGGFPAPQPVSFLTGAGYTEPSTFIGGQGYSMMPSGASASKKQQQVRGTAILQAAAAKYRQPIQGYSSLTSPTPAATLPTKKDLTAYTPAQQQVLNERKAALGF